MAKATKTVKKAATASKSSKASKSTNPGRKSWTDADMNDLKTLVKQNTPTRLIAMKMKRSVASIYTKAGKEGISLAPTNRSPRD